MTLSKLQPYLLKELLKIPKKLEESDIMFSNTIFICIFQYRKILDVNRTQ